MVVKHSVQQCTFLEIGVPNGSGWTVTTPLSASSKTVADTVVLIGTPSLLQWKDGLKHKATCTI